MGHKENSNRMRTLHMQSRYRSNTVSGETFHESEELAAWCCISLLAEPRFVRLIYVYSLKSLFDSCSWWEFRSLHVFFSKSDFRKMSLVTVYYRSAVTRIIEKRELV
jgi:hypothetical protein